VTSFKQVGTRVTKYKTDRMNSKMHNWQTMQIDVCQISVTFLTIIIRLKILHSRRVNTKWTAQHTYTGNAQQTPLCNIQRSQICSSDVKLYGKMSYKQTPSITSNNSHFNSS